VRRQQREDGGNLWWFRELGPSHLFAHLITRGRRRLRPYKDKVVTSVPTGSFSPSGANVMLLTGLIGLLPGKLACSLTQMLFRNP